MFHFLPGPLHSIVPFIIVLGVLVFFHELGHYLAARWQGVHVEAFSIGFGRPIARWTDRLGTQWRLSWLPLGGYVKLHGQERPQDVAPEVRAAWQPGRTFQEKSLRARAIVIFAGPLANFLLAAVLFTLLLALHGKPVPVEPPRAIVGDVAPDSAAARAGLLPGDVILRINAKPVATFEDVRGIVSALPASRLAIDVTRDGQALTLGATSDEVQRNGKRIGQLGIVEQVTYQRVSLPEAVLGGVTETWETARQTLAGVATMITGRASSAEIGGMLRIANISGEVADRGALSLVNLIALLSVNIGLINLFPIPILDGGHLMFYLIEAIRGRPLPPRAMEYGFRAGFALIAALMLFAFFNDLTNLGWLRWVSGLIGHT